MGNRKGWTPAERRAMEDMQESAGTVRMGQLIAILYGLWALFTGQWGRALFCFGLAAFLQCFLPHMGPEWEDRALEIDENNDGGRQ